MGIQRRKIANSLIQLAGIGFGIFQAGFVSGATLHLKSGDIQLKDRSAQIQLLSKKTTWPFSEEASLYLLQFEGALDQVNEKLLLESGLKVIRYLPDFTYLVSGTGHQVLTTKEKLNLPAILSEFSPQWKLSENLLGEQISSLETVQRVFIKTISDESVARVQAQIQDLKQFGRLVPSESPQRIASGLIAASLSFSQIQEISNSSDIEWIEAMPLIETFVLEVSNDGASPAVPPALTGFESGTRLMGFESTWSRGLNGSGQVGAIGDTGVDTGNTADIHSDLNGNLFGGVTLGRGSKSWEDTNGHGTHVAGSVVGNGMASDGQIKGGAFAGRLFVVGLWSPLFNGLVFNPSFDRIFGDAYKAGAKVHSNSWGSGANLGAYDAMASQVDEYCFRTQDFLALFAAGNSGVDLDQNGVIDLGSVSSPGTAKNVLTVGAAENYLLEGGRQVMHKEMNDGMKKWGAEPIASDKLSNSTKGLAAFSSRGPTKDGRLKPEIVASGTNIVSLQSRHPSASKLWGSYNEFYSYAGGTSMATPLTAGAALVVRQYLQQEKGFQNPSGALVKAVLMHTAEDLFPGQYGEMPATREISSLRPNVQEGFGRVDMNAATTLPPNSLLLDSTTGIGTGEFLEFSINAATGSTVMATLTYMDAPGSPAAAKALINDLDLELVGHAGVMLSNADRVNNTEYLETRIDESLGGNLKLRVRAVNVPQGKNGKQPFALVVSVR